MASSVSIEMYRFDPSVDEAPGYQTYEVPIEDESQPWSILKMLHYINANIEPISYDYNCRWGACGRCGVLVNGAPKLACWAKVEPGKSYKVDPLPGFRVIKDLVIDKDTAYERFVGTVDSVQSLQPITELKGVEGQLWWDTLKNFARCRECLQCYAVCPTLQQDHKWEKYIGPGAMMQIAHRWMDAQDQGDRLSQAVFSGVFECQQCGACQAVCPAMIKITEVNKALMDAAEAAGLKVTPADVAQGPFA